MGERRLTVGRLILAVALVAAALAVTILLQNVIPIAGYIIFYAAVMTSAWFGGLWSGAISAVLSVLAVEYFFVPPLHSFQVHRDYVPVFVEFVVSSLIVGWFSSWRREAELELQSKVAERTAELRRTNESLIAEIAERKRAEAASLEARAELARLTRMSAMGALAASISHEVNQPLAAVVTNADACAIWLSADPPNINEARATVDCIAREGTRASDIIRRIRSLFAKSAPERAAVQVNDLIRDAAALLQNELSRNRVELKTELDLNLPSVSADRIQLQQVIANLIMNAIEAMDKVEGARILLLRSEVRAPREIAVVIKDSGIGIETQNQKQIFDPFFTTKSSGMGMGLAISQSIIEAHGGRLWATANEGPGTTLQFTLPIAL
jgi:C4-dicarboxylate-specific signal transduction histidine kinase